MTKKINIQGKKVILSNFQETDISKQYLNWLNDPEVVKFSRQRFINHDFFSSKNYFDSFIGSKNLFISIKLSEGNQMIGTMTVYFKNHNAVDVGIMIGDKSKWGRGYGKDAWNSLLVWLENELNIVKITAGTLASNTGMLKLIKESGMLLESIKKNHEIVDNISVDVLYFSKLKS